MTAALAIPFKKEPQGKALLRLQLLLAPACDLEAHSNELAGALSDAEAGTFCRDTLFDLIEHLCVAEEDYLAIARHIALLHLNFSEVRNGSA